ncbi:hypothetical protein L226DRAFT_466820 [Lentinus tigrinus ALCF2SS1-7]|uniref:hAT-like transposase RNase-H fold domain-containing protein n=1 Tax=Lentinus tigrinus ALCF2SS1-6 TaxID=1328759 RepID=A0A5C2RKY3_9APHY|nr:hypothetical protein L227DRAFT_515121 [Lentinus tigrinus ALCF2SS1-6]RPD72622.1 hypothetical protein L226DRAFT_466820 [Lentinus tigrinus ALCF2SS1-7]
MAEAAVEYRPAIERLCAQRDSGLRAYELSEREWGILAQLRDVLKIFKHATLFFSTKTPNLAKVIHAMDHIDTVLTNQIRDKNLNSALWSALTLGKNVLNHYYKLSDLSATYRIALMLHPSYKDVYFKDAGWPTQWIKNAHDMLREEFDRSYPGPDMRNPSPAPDAPAELAGHSSKTSKEQGQAKGRKGTKASKGSNDIDVSPHFSSL